MNTDIRAIYIDLGDTFRVVLKEKDYILEAKRKIAQMCDTDEDPEIYRVCSRDLGIPCEEIASVADNQKRDIEGAREAGIAYNVIYNSPEKKHPVDLNGDNPPDAVVNDFSELLALFPWKEA